MRLPGSLVAAGKVHESGRLPDMCFDWRRQREATGKFRSSLCRVIPDGKKIHVTTGYTSGLAAGMVLHADR